MNQGDSITLALGTGKKNERKVDYMAEDESSPGAFRAVVYLPEGTGQIGMSGVLTKSEYTRKQECCVPVEALYSENNGARYYVYVAGERDGILGKELYVEKRTVKLTEQNEQYAALEPGALSSEDRVITASDKELRENDAIRYKD